LYYDERNNIKVGKIIGIDCSADYASICIFICSTPIFSYVLHSLFQDDLGRMDFGCGSYLLHRKLVIQGENENISESNAPLYVLPG
jgi:hypothetical protein